MNLKKILFVLCILTFTLQSTAAFSVEFPNHKISAFNAAIQKAKIQINCWEHTAQFKCIQVENRRNGICYLETSITTATPDTFSCDITNHTGTIVNTISIDKLKLETMYRVIDTIQQKQYIFNTSDNFLRKHIQEYTYSCEISATSDILSTIKQKIIREDELIKKIWKSWFGKSSQKHTNGRTIWGNPNEGFVWNIHVDEKWIQASQRRMTGYGVYEQPIAQLYSEYGVNSKIINYKNHTADYTPKQHLTELLTELEAWNFVQFWGDVCTNPLYDDGEINLNEMSQAHIVAGKIGKNNCWSWKLNRDITWYYKQNGKLVKHTGLIGEHNFYMLGYRGTKENPNHIILWDTQTGEHMYPTAEFMRKWSAMDYRSLVIYPN